MLKTRKLSVTALNHNPEDWLNVTAKEFQDASSDTLQLPKHDDGSDYLFSSLFDDQKEVILVIMDRIKEWCESDDLSTFKPLRMILNGPAGTGKTVVINTIVSMIRSLFQDNDVVKVCAPTGVAAFNAGGETIHHFFKNRAGGAIYDPGSMPEAKKTALSSKLKTLLCMIIDERSLLDSKLLGTAEQMMSETIYDGSLADKSWGHLPVLVLVGDDYQLPGVDEGPLDALTSHKGCKMTANGRSALIECSEFVMSLKSSKRIQKNRIKDKQLLAKMRVAEEMSNAEVDRLLNLHLDVMHAKHGKDVVDEIKSKSIYLFYRNYKRIQKNLEMLVAHCTKDNPVAICKTDSKGLHQGMAIKSHFDKTSKIPNSALLCLQTKVALENKNFCPLWGLHNGAVGTIEEIVFAKGTDPNLGALPLYVVVNFPQYCGPVWDTENPKVSFSVEICTHQI